MAQGEMPPGWPSVGELAGTGQDSAAGPGGAVPVEAELLSPGRVELAGGAWADLRDPASLRNRDRKALLLPLDAVTGGDIAKGLALIDELLATLVTAWSFDLPLPSVDRGSLDELTCADADRLTKAAEAARAALFPDFDPSPDRSSPTSPSSG